ncbi:MAG: HU family DNA-binding protein [Mariprofundales bacterium]|nr:HU family DNA-binding protein [Mariprofundales bacterium]
MNKADLVNIVSAEAGLSKADASKAVDAVISGIAGALSSGDSVALVGFGSFVVSERAARTARNPRTGEAIEVGPSKGVRFKAGKALKDAVN